jgi:serine/threonine protein kinase
MANNLGGTTLGQRHDDSIPHVPQPIVEVTLVHEATSDESDEAFDVETLWRLCERSPASTESDSLVGRAIGGVTLERLIAEGGMGRVYEGRQDRPARIVAVKVLRPGLLAAENLRRFGREITTLESLRHPGIARIHAGGTYEADGAELPYFVMEYIPDALPLTEYARRHGLPLAGTLDLFGQVCDAVAHGHERGIVHRDLKPSNVLVDSRGQARVIDFGVARGIGTEARMTTLTQAGQLIGTLQYMSPEQVSGLSETVDARTDVYALGVMLFELVAGRPPYELEHRGLLEATRLIRDQPPPPLESLSPTVPVPIATAVARCLAKDRSLRFPNAGALRAALDGGTAAR